MLKRLSKIILVLTMLLSLVFGQGSTVRAASQGDITAIKTRLKTYFLELDTIDDGSKVETCYVSKAEDYLKLMQEDGSFADVDYQSHKNAANGGAWDPYLALDRLQAIAIAYHKQGNALYKSEAAKNGIDKALKNWVTHGKRNKKPDGPYSDNWWENEVGVQLRFSRIGLFMEGIISNESFDIILTKLIEKKPIEKGTGQNNLWFDQNHVYYALLKNDAKKLKDMVDNYLNYCLSIQLDDKTAEAVQVDNSFYMHGKQFYSNGYGMSMFRDMSFWIYILRGTEFAIGQDVVDRMADYMLDGTSWTIRGDIMEMYLGYRPYKFDVGYQNYAEEYIEPLKRMIISDTKNASRYQAVLDNIEGKNITNGKDGNHYMWRSGYASHMRDGYGVNIKMDSKDIIGGEWRGSTQKNGQLIYWTSSAASSITVDGDEYTKVYPTFDWAHVPGTTTANRIVADFSNYGRFTNGTDHTIGVSNGKYGATAYVMDKKDTKASKGYFFFDDEFVALGAGISSKESVNIHTTLNQSKAKNVTVNGNTVSTGTKGKSYTGQWLHNDKTGYVFPKETTVQVSNRLQADNPSLWEQKEKDATPETFTAWIDHGLKPKDASYEYIVLPNKTSQEVEQYSKNNPIQIVANTKDVQAVRHDGLKQTQINFYKAGSLEYKDGYTVTVDYPCSMIIDESSATRKITVAVNDQSAHQVINVQLDNNNVKTSTVFTTKGLPYAGQSITLTEGQDDRYQASSSSTGHPVKNAVDGNNSTYWESQGNTDEWISLFVGTSQYIKDIDILWGEQYAKQYDVYASKDGLNYQKIKSVTDGKGNKENVTIGGMYKYIKLVMKESSGNCYQMKEVTFHNSQLLSQNKTVNVSSTSTNDPGNVKQNAVDGNLNTRWSSLRKESGFDKQEEWISVDLGRKARIDAIELVWETARSNNYSIEVSDDNKTWKTVKENLKSNSSLKDQMILDEIVEARYVRIHSYSSATKYGISIYELSVYGQNISKNISLNKAVEASSVYKNNNNAAAELAVDEKSDTKWSSARKDPGFNKQEEWISVDLGEVSYIDGIEIDWETGCSDDYSIEISDDNKTWTTVKEHLKSNTIASIAKHYIDQIQFDKPLEARYVRIHSSSSRTKWGINIWELKVLGEVKDMTEPEPDPKPEPEPEPEGTNIALNKIVDSSSHYNDETETKAAVDGKLNTKWSSERKETVFNTQEEWMSVDLGSIASIDAIVIDWETGCSDDYSIEISDDNKTWTTVKEHLKSNTVASSDKHYIDNVLFDKPIDARYVKIHSFSSRTKWGINIWELKVLGEVKDIPEPEEINIALNKPSTASSEFLDTKDGNKVYYSSLAFDGSVDKVNNKQSRWVSNRNSNDEWIYVDLQDTYDISKVILNWEGACGKEYKIQVSDDAQNWKDVSHITNGKAGIKTLTYDKPVRGQYVRMLGIIPENNGKYGYSLWEFEVYGTLVKQETINRALNKPSTASSVRKNPTSGFMLESKYAFDGSVENRGDIFQSRWVSATRKDNPGVNVDSQYIQVDLEDVYNIEKIVLNWEGACGKEYKLQVSNDGENWIDISHVTDGKPGIKEFTYDIPKTGRYVRMLGIQPSGEYGYSLWEFEVYGITLKSELKAYYDQNKNIDVSMYIPKTVTIYQDALENAVTVYKDKEATASQILKAKEQLQKAVAGLVKKADKTDLINEIKKAQNINKELYINKTIKVLEDALQLAQKVNNDENVTQDQVKSVVLQLEKALNELIKKANKDVLANEIKKAESIDQDKYTKESIKALEKVLKDAKDIYQDSQVLQSQVDKIVDSLKDAITSLEVKKDDPIVEEQDVIIQNNNKDITIKGQLPKDVVLFTTAFNNQKVNEIIEQINQQNSEFLQSATLERVYTLELLLNQQVYDINGEVTVTLNIDGQLIDKNLGIIYIDDLGNVTKIPSRREGDQLIFTTTHFSTYAIVSYDDATNEDVTLVPSTGDTSSIALYVVMMLGAGYLLLRKKKED